MEIRGEKVLIDGDYLKEKVEKAIKSNEYVVEDGVEEADLTDCEKSFNIGMECALRIATVAINECIIETLDNRINDISERMKKIEGMMKGMSAD